MNIDAIIALLTSVIGNVFNAGSVTSIS